MSESKAKFTNLPAEQINKLRDAFQLIDQDNDGNISHSDLKKIYESIGNPKTDEEINKMLTTDVSFTNYLTLLSNQLSSVPNKNEIIKAMKVFSEDMEINIRELKESLIKSGLTEKEIDSVLNNFKSERMNGDQIFMGNEFLNYIT